MSLGQELKDFVGASTAAYKITADRRDKKRDYERAIINDEIDNEYKKVNTERVLKGNQWFDRDMESTISARGAQSALQAKQLSWYDRIQQSLIDARQVDAFKTLYGAGKVPTAIDPGDAPEGDPSLYEDQSSLIDPAAYSAIPLPAVRHQYAAEGGLVLNEEEERARMALPVEAPIPPVRPPTPQQQAPAPETTPAQQTDPRVVGFDMAHQAVMEGVQYAMKQAGLDKESAIDDGSQGAKIANYLKGAGAAPKSLIDQAYQIVDPNNELSESERTMGALGTVYNHYIRQGDSEKAKKAAASIVQYQRRLFSTYASIAQAAAENGDIDNTVEAAVRAYASVPDGRDLKVAKTEDGRYAVQIINEATGEVVDKPILTPEEIGAWALKVTPGSFDQYIGVASGEQEPPPSGGFREIVGALDNGQMPTNEQMASLSLEEQKELRARMKEIKDAGPQPVSYEQMTKTRETLNGMWDEMAGQMAEAGDETMANIAPAARATILTAASDILTNPRNRGEVNASEQDAIDAAGVVALTRDFKATNEQGGKRITLPDERSFWMPMARFRQLDNLYKQNDKAARDTKRKQTAISNRDAASAEQDRRDQEEIFNRMHQTGNVPSPLTGAITNPLAIPVDNGSQAALDRLNELLGQ